MKKQGSHSIELLSQEASKGHKLEVNKLEKKKKMPAKVPQADKNEQKLNRCHLYKKVGY